MEVHEVLDLIEEGQVEVPKFHRVLVWEECQRELLVGILHPGYLLGDFVFNASDVGTST